MGKTEKGVRALDVFSVWGSHSPVVLNASHLPPRTPSRPTSCMSLATVYVTLDKSLPSFRPQFPHLSERDDIKNPESYLGGLNEL